MFPTLRVSIRNAGLLVTALSVSPLAARAQAAPVPQTTQASGTVPIASTDSVIAIVGATVIDGNGGPALPDATIVVRGHRIAEIGPRASIRVPAGARVIDATGKFATPGFTDTNVHLSLYNNGESMVRYADRFVDLVAEAAQTELKYGVTTVRDSYGALLPLIEVRDSIARGQLVGPRMLVAGNIVGWGGPKSPLFSNSTPTTYFDEQMMDFIAKPGRSSSTCRPTSCAWPFANISTRDRTS